MKTPYKILIAGAGFAGAITGRQLLKHSDAEVIMLDRSAHIEDSVSGTGLNLNPNGMSALQSLDPKLANAMRSVGLPRSTMKAETMQGTKLYEEAIHDQNGNGLALNNGLRIRWADAYAAVRSGLPILYNQEVLGYESDEALGGKMSVNVHDSITGKTHQIDGIDFIIGADGRYSNIRNQISPAETTFIGVCNFRLLVPDTSGELFEDMELIYNLKPARLENEAGATSDFQYAANTLPRIGIMKMPATENREQMLYLFGNFGIKDDVPEIAKTKEGLLALFTPRDSGLSPKGQYILQILEQNHDRLHWARMQHTPPIFGNNRDNVMLLGDAAHAIVPTLGQGATLAIEDACVASEILLNAIQRGHLGLACTRQFEQARLDRRRFVSDVSIEASLHLMKQEGYSASDLMSNDIACWQDEGQGFRRKMRRVWRGGPVISHDYSMKG